MLTVIGCMQYFKLRCLLGLTDDWYELKAIIRIGMLLELCMEAKLGFHLLRNNALVVVWRSLIGWLQN